MTVELWLPVIGFEGLYEVSSFGRVRRSHKSTTGRAAGSIKAQNLNPDGYYYVRLWRVNVQHVLKVHRLVVASFFGEKPYPEFEVRHMDADKTNNHISNLCYGTKSDNSRDQVEQGVHAWAKRTHCKNGHEFTPENTSGRSDCHGRKCLACQRNYRRAYEAKVAANGGARLGAKQKAQAAA